MLREVGHKLGRVFDRLAPEIKPGRTTYEIDRLAERFIREENCTPGFKNYDGFPGSICASVNDMLIHGIPAKNIVLHDGDIISIDMGNIDNVTHFQGDACRTYAVGNISAEALRLIRCSEECFFEAFKACKPGAHLYEISMAIDRVAKSYGYSLCKEYGGHGLGKEMHEDPFIPNYYSPALGLGPILKEGMCIAIEPMVLQGRPEVRILSDGWGVQSVDHKLTSHYENDVIITSDGAEIISVDSNVRRHLADIKEIKE
jgi:methionyl aminopeptidase